MKDKITLGKFIQSKRKENGLSQKELADKLYITESAVSKWERGVSYPDITMISGICEALNISEHELCSASEDINQRRLNLMAAKYKRFLMIYNGIFVLGYLAALIPCFIVFILKEHRPSKFFILLTSLMMSASVLNLPTLISKNQALISFAGFYASLNLLFLSGSIYSGGSWFLMAFLGTTLGLSIVFLPFIIRSEPLSTYTGSNKSLICMLADSVILVATVAYGTLKYGTWQSFREGMLVTVWCLLIVWIIFAVIRYAKINIFFKIASVMASISVWITASDYLFEHFYNSGNYFMMININGEGYTGITSLIIAASAVIFTVIGGIFRYRRKSD